MLSQNTLSSNPKARKKRKRLGRGAASGHGNFSGRGVKGQKARTGGKIRRGFEGGQTPIIRKMPKLRGFSNPNRNTYQIVNLEELNIFDDGTEITKKLLYEHKLIKSIHKPVKLLGRGVLQKKLKISLDAISKSAVSKINLPAS